MPHDAFHVGSDAKAMLATLIAQEIERGRLRWDTRVEEVLPQVMVTARDEYRGVTVADLLTHRAGLVQLLEIEDLNAVPALRGGIRAQRQQFATWALAQPPVAAPGTSAHYSNAGYVVAAAMLEAVAGDSYESLLVRRLFLPLRMYARFGWPAETRNPAPWGHATVEGRLVPIDPREPGSRIPAWANPAGNLSMDTRSFARFVQAHLRGLRGDAGILQPATFSELHTVRGELAAGWAVVDLGDRQISLHEGGSGIFYALMIIDASHDVAALVLANADNDRVREAALTLALEIMAAKARP
jgi:CubicO group peptidase (beta-lactamase class C family)